MPLHLVDIFYTIELILKAKIERTGGLIMAKEQILAPEDVFELVKSYMNEEHVTFVVKAFEVAKEAHKEQFRSSGEPYIIHPVQVAGNFAELQMGSEKGASGFFHDVVGDTEVTPGDLVNELCEEEAKLVDGGTKPGEI